MSWIQIQNVLDAVGIYAKAVSLITVLVKMMWLCNINAMDARTSLMYTSATPATNPFAFYAQRQVNADAGWQGREMI